MYKKIVYYPANINSDTYTIPEGIKSVGADAFIGAQSLTEINFPDSVTDIGESAFGFCDLANVEIPKNITRINDSTFMYCTSLKEIELNEGLKIIENHDSRCI